MTAIPAPGRDQQMAVLKTLSQHGASVADWAAHAAWYARNFPPGLASNPQIVAQAATTAVENHLPPADVPAVPDDPDSPSCVHCGQAASRLNPLVQGPDGPLCDDADECEDEREARLPMFRRHWRELWRNPSGTGWHWVEKYSGGMGDVAYPSGSPVYDESVPYYRYPADLDD